jgi:16S rRNA (cytosine967-C5)-methyltransferase
MDDMASRLCALEVLQAVLRRQQSLDEALSPVQCRRLSTLETRDRAFVHALVACTLRRLGQIDSALGVCLERPDHVKPQVMDILRLGAAQILFLGTPSHAAVDTSVRLITSIPSLQALKGLVNAVLRRLTREGQTLVKGQDEARLNTPDWLWRLWEKSYGSGQTRAMALAHLGEAMIDLTVKEDPEIWAERLKAKLLPTGSVRLSDFQSIPEIEGFQEGCWWVQDAAAALPVALMPDVKGKRVIDLCAAPGGKTLQLAARGAKVTAVDRSDKRLNRLRENLKRTQLPVTIICADALTYRPEEKADIVLLDAPCSATGTIRRHPDVQRLKTPEDMARMTALQARLLDHAAQELVRADGLLVYAVCSLQAQEAEEQVAAFLARTPTWQRLPVKANELGGAAELIDPQGDVRCLPSHWPQLGGLDGFYVARLVMKK